MVVIVSLQYLKEWMEDIQLGLILDYEETLVLETETETLLGDITEPPTEERDGPMQAVALQQYANANSEGGKKPRHDSGHSFPRLPILTMKKATLRKVHQVSFCGIFYCIITFAVNNYSRQR